MNTYNVYCNIDHIKSRPYKKLGDDGYTIVTEYEDYIDTIEDINFIVNCKTREIAYDQCLLHFPNAKNIRIYPSVINVE